MTTVDYAKVPIQTKALHVPPLEEMADGQSILLEKFTAFIKRTIRIAFKREIRLLLN